MKKLNLKTIVMFYTLLIIGCGVSPEQSSTDLSSELNEIQFIVKDNAEETTSKECLQKGISIIRSGHQGGGSVAPPHQGGGSLTTDHQGGGSVIKNLQYIALKAQVDMRVDAILINDATSVAFTQNKDGHVQTQFCIDGDDFTLMIYAGERSMKLDVKDYQ